MFESLSFFIQFLHFSIASAISFINCKLPISSFSYQSTLSSSFTMRFFIQYSTRYFHNYQHFYCPCIVSIIDNPKFVLDPKERKQKSIPVINILESISTCFQYCFISQPLSFMIFQPSNFILSAHSRSMWIYLCVCLPFIPFFNLGLIN